MRKIDKLLWIAVAIVGILDLAVFISHAKAPDKVATSSPEIHPLKPPTTGKINVAFIISDGANVMDIAGAWEVFSDSMLTSKGKPWHDSDGDDMVMPFNAYTVSDSVKPVDANGLTIVPNYSFDTAPKPQVIVIPAQGGRTPAQKAWLLANSRDADVTMSVCTGASMLARTDCSMAKLPQHTTPTSRRCRKNILQCISSAEPGLWRMARLPPPAD